MLLTMLSVILLYKPVNVYACGPFFTEVRFALHDKPGESVQRFIQGHVGIVSPDYDDRYLNLAYDYYSGVRFTQQQQDSILSEWSPPHQSRFSHESNAVDIWIALRNRVKAEHLDESIEQYYFGELRPGEYVSYLNINDDAFIHAAEVLKARVQEYGYDNPAVIDWVNAQNQVFELGGRDNSGNIPGDCDAKYPLVFQYDRFYQIASAHFYLRNYDYAESVFRDLSVDLKNPWAKLCRYMVARTLIRKGTLAYSQPEVIDTPVFEQARAYLQGIINDTSMGSFRIPAKRLLNLVKIRYKRR